MKFLALATFIAAAAAAALPDSPEWQNYGVSTVTVYSTVTATKTTTATVTLPAVTTTKTTTATITLPAVTTTKTTTVYSTVTEKAGGWNTWS